MVVKLFLVGLGLVCLGVSGCSSAAAPSPVPSSPIPVSVSPSAYCDVLAYAKTVSDPEGAQLSPDQQAQRSAYVAKLNEASDVAQAGGRQDVSVFLSLAAKVRSDPSAVTSAELTRLQEMTPTVQAQIDKDCSAVNH